MFGYENRSNNPITLQAGNTCNFFLPISFRTGLISTFFPGLHERAFRVQLAPSETALLWILGNQTVTTELVQGPPSSVANPIATLPPATVSAPYLQRLAAVGGSATPTWSAVTHPSSLGNAALPPGLTLSADGTLSGTPTVAGEFVIKVRATDGVTTVGKSYSVSVGGGLALDDAVSIRAPGFTPQFRLVNSVATTIGATANCNADEFVVTGGGQCTIPNNNTVLGRISSSAPLGNGWAVTCSGGTATAVAVCSQK